MWRSFFMALAITLMILGIECLFVGKAILANSRTLPERYDSWSDPLFSTDVFMVDRTFEPPEWAPFSLLSAGAVLWLYSVSLRRGGGGGEE